MTIPIPDNAIIVTTDSLRSDDPMDLVAANIDFVNALYSRGIQDAEVSLDAIRSYYVDYYLAQVNNGGFAQFVYNSRWNPRLLEIVRDGLREIGAPQHLEMLEQGARLVEQLGAARLQTFFNRQYFGENPERDMLNAANETFFDVSMQEDVVALNAAWLRRHPALVALEPDEIEAEIQRRTTRE